MLADTLDPVDRAVAVAIFAAITFIGPVAGPVVGGFITMSYLGWRWTEYITAIMGFFFGTVCFSSYPRLSIPSCSNNGLSTYDTKPRTGPYTPRAKRIW